jgi:hypothetical protein
LRQQLLLVAKGVPSILVAARHFTWKARTFAGMTDRDDVVHKIASMEAGIGRKERKCKWRHLGYSDMDTMVMLVAL